MYEFFNWTNTSILWGNNLMYLLAAFGLGAYIGYITCEPVNDNPQN
jgi:hypothetical protein